MSSVEWKKKNTTQINMRVTNASGIPKALDKACERLGCTRMEFFKMAIFEKLEKEGIPIIPEKHNNEDAP